MERIEGFMNYYKDLCDPVIDDGIIIFKHFSNFIFHSANTVKLYVNSVDTI